MTNVDYQDMMGEERKHVECFSVKEHGEKMKKSHSLDKDMLNALTVGDSYSDEKDTLSTEDIIKHKEQEIVSKLKATGAKIRKVETTLIGKRRFKRRLAKEAKKLSKQLA